LPPSEDWHLLSLRLAVIFTLAYMKWSEGTSRAVFLFTASKANAPSPLSGRTSFFGIHSEAGKRRLTKGVAEAEANRSLPLSEKDESSEKIADMEEARPTL
jgi:hypothetical protein